MLKRLRAVRVPWPAPSFFASRPLMCAVLCFLAGVCGALLLPLRYAWWLWVIPAGLLGAGVLLRRHRRVALALAFAGMFALGLARSGQALHAPDLPPVGNWAVEGTVDGAVNHNGRGAMFFLRDVQVQPEGDEVYTHIEGKVYIYYATSAQSKLVHGQRVRVEGKAYLPTDARNPGGFDQRMWLAQQGAHVRMYVDRAPQMLEAAPRFSVMGTALSVNRELGARADAVFGGASPVIRAMLLGDQKAMPDEWSGWMRDSGIAHLLAVSGLHVGLWFLLVRRATAMLPISPGVRWCMLAAVLALYALLTGLKPSVLRAVVMLLMIQGGQVAGRRSDPLTNIAAAAFLILIVRPLDLFGAGMQLSFCAVLGIVLLRPALSQVLPKQGRAAVDALATTASAQVGILPASSYWFGTTSLLGALANLVAVPLTGLLIPVAALALVLNAIWPPLGWLLVEASRGMVTVLMLLARVAASVPLAFVRVGAFAWWTSAVFFVCLFLCCSAVVWRWRWRFVAMGACGLLALAIGFFSGSFLPQYVQLDVGQALSGVLHVGTKTYVYDAGDENSDLTEYLLHTGNGIDGLFISHPHRDHFGGLGEVLDNGIPIRTVYVPVAADAFGADDSYYERLEQAQAQGASLVEISAGDVLPLDGGAVATVIGPQAEAMHGDANGRSLVLLVEIGEHLLLLMGDADGATEPLGVDTDVLQVAHHGSKNAARDAFLEDATPDIALVSTGRNTYGHPNDDTLARLEAAGADTYITRDTGAVTVFFAPNGLRVQTFVP